MQKFNIAKMFGRSLCSSQEKGIKNILIIGGGQMGSGIAQVSAMAGYTVNLVDMNTEILSTSSSMISRGLKLSARKLKSTGASEEQVNKIKNSLDNITFNSDFSSVAGSVDLVMEAVVEKIDVKKQIFQSLSNLCKESTIFATNTSSLPVGEIMNGIGGPERCAGLHFFNPVPLMRLVEVIKLTNTSQETTAALKKYVESLGKTFVQCKDTPGFIVNRLLLPYLIESMKMYDRGDAELKDIDTAMKAGANYPIGPFELSDLIGLDTIKFILDFWAQTQPDDPQFKSIEILDRLVSEGKLGIKTKQGFYNYNK